MPRLPWGPPPPDVDKIDDRKPPKQNEDEIGPPFYVPPIRVPQPDKKRTPTHREPPQQEPPQPSASPVSSASGWQF